MSCQDLPSPVSPLLLPVSEGSPGRVKGPPEDDRVSSGCSQSPGPSLPRTRSPVVRGSKGNLKKGRVGMSTGRSAWLRRASSLLPESKPCSEASAMPNSPVRQPRPNMSGKKRPRLLVPALSLERNPLIEHREKDGRRSGNLPKKENLSALKLKFVFVITGLSGLLLPIFRSLLSENLLLSSIMDVVEVENLAELGMRPAYQLIVKTHCPSFGAVMEAIEALSLMNIEEGYRSVIFYDGWTDIRSTWKLKGRVSHCVPTNFGLPQTSIRNRGTQI